MSTVLPAGEAKPSRKAMCFSKGRKGMHQLVPFFQFFMILSSVFYVLVYGRTLGHAAISLTGMAWSNLLVAFKTNSLFGKSIGRKAKAKISTYALIITFLVFYQLYFFGSMRITWAQSLARCEDDLWIYRKPITITENSGSTLTDYQVNLTVDYVSGKMNSDFSDLRFTNSTGSELSYWIQSYTASTSAKVWVKVPRIPASGTETIYVYYGNSTATTTSNVDNTFIRVIDGIAPVGYGAWNLDEGTGTAVADSSGRANTGTASGGPTWVNGKFGKALSFDGTDDYVYTAKQFTPAGTIPYSISVWFRATVADGNMMVTFETYQTGTTCSQHSNKMWIGTGSKLYFGVWTTADRSIATAGAVTDGNWHHAVGTYNATAQTTYLYVDGNFNGSYALGANAQAVLGYWKIGAYCGGWATGGSVNGYFNGTVDELMIYNKTLTSAEISDIYNNYAYTTTNYPGRALVRKYASPEPSAGAWGSEQSKDANEAWCTGCGYSWVAGSGCCGDDAGDLNTCTAGHVCGNTAWDSFTSDWTVSGACTISSTVSMNSGSLYVQNGGELTLQSPANIKFLSTNQYIYIYSGGTIYVNSGAGFNKP